MNQQRDGALRRADPRRSAPAAPLLTVEHDMGVVSNWRTRIAVLVQGEVIAFDTPERVRADPRVQAPTWAWRPRGP